MRSLPCLLLAGLLAACDAGSSGPVTRREVYDACVSHVRQALNAPANAVFAEAGRAEVGRLRDGSYRVRSYFDEPQAGAKPRRNLFTCTLLEGDGGLRVEGLTQP